MKLTRRELVVIASGFAATVFAGQSFAASHVIQVSLWDKGAGALHMLNQGPMMGMGMGARGQNAPMGPMGISLSSQTVSAGKVTFEVSNTSRHMGHEMIVAPIKNTRTPLPYDQATHRVDEKAAGSLGEVEELAPGKSGSMTLTLKPGRYILYCNIAGHYALGMWTLLTVKA